MRARLHPGKLDACRIVSPSAGGTEPRRMGHCTPMPLPSQTMARPPRGRLRRPRSCSCPNCDEWASVDAYSGFVRLTCPACGYVQEVRSNSRASGPINPRSGLAVYGSGNTLSGARLWLATECSGGKRLWALNRRGDIPAHWPRPMSSPARVRRTMLNARFELQLAPTLTVPPEVRETVSRAFEDAGVVFDWLPMPGDFTGRRRCGGQGGIERIAQPSLDVVLSCETDTDPARLVESVHNELASALVRVRSDAPDLPISVRSHTPSGRCWFAFRPSASPEDIADGLTRVREAETSSGVAGWDERARTWVRL
jgi:hypothetical protein